MKIKTEFKKYLFHFSVFFILIYIPLFFTIYSSSWYDFNFSLYDTNFEKEFIEIQKNNLIDFFFHIDTLNNNWTQKEKSHFLDVRRIYDTLFILFILSLIIFLSKRKDYKIQTKNNLKVILSFLIVLPFFPFFWNNIFHTILFNNLNWINTPEDISYYLFQLDFFINSFLFIFFVFVLENLFILNLPLILSNKNLNKK